MFNSKPKKWAIFASICTNAEYKMPVSYYLTFTLPGMLVKVSNYLSKYG